MASSGLPQGTSTYTGLGHAGNWSDPANWSGGVAPTGLNSTALFTSNAAMNGSFSTGQMMMLGTEAITVNGTLNTLSPGFCTSFMICNGATVTFTPTATLNDAGGLIVGVHADGTLIAQGAGAAHATMNTVDGKMGLFAGSNGAVTIDDAVWNNSEEMRVGAAGQGSLAVTDGGQVHVGAAILVGAKVGGTGQVTVSGGSQIVANGGALIGGGLSGDPAGTGSVTVNAGSLFSAGACMVIGSHGTMTLAGGTASLTNAGTGLIVAGGGTLSGHGTFNMTAAPGTSIMGIADSGMIQASGGTLVVNASVDGAGQMSIAANSTLAINGAHINAPVISFVGSNGTLALATGIVDHAIITGFAAGDTLLMAGVDTLGWNPSTDVLTLSAGTHVVDHVQFAGTYASNAFTLTQSSAGAMIGLAAVHTGH